MTSPRYDFSWEEMYPGWRDEEVDVDPYEDPAVYWDDHGARDAFDGEDG